MLAPLWWLCSGKEYDTKETRARVCRKAGETGVCVCVCVRAHTHARTHAHTHTWKPVSNQSSTGLREHYGATCACVREKLHTMDLTEFLPYNIRYHIGDDLCLLPKQ